MKIPFNASSVLLLSTLLIVPTAELVFWFWCIFLGIAIVADALQQERWEEAERLRRMRRIPA